MENVTLPHAQQTLSVVAFTLDQRTFALPLDVIVQILPMMTITPIPHINKVVMGSINIRGEDILVVNLRTHFNFLDVEPQLYTPLLLLKIKEHSLALMVDAVLDVMNLPADTITKLQHMLPEGIEDIPLLQGVSHFQNETILVLNPEHLFDHQNRNLRETIETLNAPEEEPLASLPAENG